MKRFLFYVSTIVIIIFLEIVFSKFSVFGLLFVIFIGLYRGSNSGCTAGFFIGLIEGVFSVTTFGVLSFSYSIVGYLSGRIPRRMDEENPVAQISVVFLGVIAAQIINLIIEVIFSGIPGVFSLFGLIFSVVLAPVLFFIFRKWWLLWFDRLEVER